MEAIVLTDEQAAEILAANGESHLTLEPRRLLDGRLILNADVLDDPVFTDRARGWARVLLGDEILQEDAEGGEVLVSGEGQVVNGEMGIAAGTPQRVTLSENDLKEA